MNILLLGSGGREHALAWKISQSPLCKQLFIAPGNAGTLNCGINVPLNIIDFDMIRDFVLQNAIKMVVVGPEEPLVKGIHDYFLDDNRLSKIPVIGPQKIAAQLEGSKDYSKRFMKRHNIPTASYESFTMETIDEGMTYLKNHSMPVVLKADGLAAGKGVLICNGVEEAQKELFAMLAGAKFGTASDTVVIEEFLNGIELSVFVITDGKSYKILPEAKDYKRVGEGDSGLNTGGMGSVSPVPFATPDFIKKVEERIIVPTLNGLKMEGVRYKGFLFIGLMKVGPDPYVIEYNARMGDPETESVIPRIKSDIVELLEGVGNEDLHLRKLEIDRRTAVTIMLVSGGYPGDYEKNKEIKNMDSVKDSLIFHAGTDYTNGKLITSGGRVMAVTTLAEDMSTALEICKANADRILFDEKYYRKDIGFDLV